MTEATEFEPESGEIAARDLRVLEAVLFASAEPLAPEEIATYLAEGADVVALLEQLAEGYEGRGVNLVRRGNRWAFRTADDLSLLLRREQTESRQLSRAALGPICTAASAERTCSAFASASE